MRTALATLLALLALFATATSAQESSTTLGQLAPHTYAACENQRTYLQVSSAPGLSSYTVPALGGIITSWSETPLGAGTERLVVGAPTVTSGQYTVVGLSTAELVSGTETQTFAVHIPVQAGDVLGLEPVSGSFSCMFPPSASGDMIASTMTSPVQGQTLTPTTTDPGERLNLTATLQPDADHDGYADVTEDGCPTDPSTHETCPVPIITGIATVGQTLSANPGGAPENPSYAWLRCGGEGSNCYAIAGATGLTYTVTSVDLGHTLRFRKTASNSQDTQVTESAPTTLVPFASTAAITPKLSSVSQSSAHWREGNALALFSRRSTAPLGTVFSFTLNLPVPVKLSFTQKASGRLVSNQCVAQTKHNEHRSSCTRTVTLGTLHSTAHVGKNKVAFQGRLSPSLKLKPGLYTVTLTAGSSGQHSASKALTFRILEP